MTPQRAGERDAPVLEAGDRPETGAGELGPCYRQLKARRGVPEGLVAIDQDRRIRRAMISLVAERGYPAVSVRDVTGRAGVSSKAFYRLYPGREECLVRCYDELAGAAARSLLVAAPRSREPRRRLLAGLEEFMLGLHRRPETARFALLECVAGGGRVHHEIRRMEAIHGALLAECFREVRSDQQDEEIFRGCAVDGITQVARAALLGGGEMDPSAVSRDLAGWVESLRFALATPSPSVSSPGPAAIAEDQDGLGDEAIGEVRRSLILAVLRIASLGTADQLTVDRVRFEAGASRRRFHSAFPDLTSCVTAARQFLFDERLGQVLGNAADPPAYDGADPALPARFFERLLRDLGPADFLLAARDEGRKGLRWETSQVWRLAALARRGDPHHPPGTGGYAAEAWVAAAWGVLRRSVDGGQAAHAQGIRRALELARHA
jgi:AcrR family transcriptional regulator